VFIKIDFLFEKFANGFNSVILVETSYLNTTMPTFSKSDVVKITSWTIFTKQIKASNRC